MKPRPKTISVPTPTSLANAALFYLSRYAASEASLRRVLSNKLRNAARAHPDFAADPTRQAELRAAIEEIIATHRRTGAVNDAAYAETKAVSLRRAGRSRRFIAQKLGQAAGVAEDLVTAALVRADEDSPSDAAAELAAARHVARRRRLGSFREKPSADPARFRKDLAALARAGFSLATARQALDHPPDDGDEECAFP